MANFLTAGRILLSMVLLFLPVFSPGFSILYLLAGITDMLDGTVARMTNTESDFGSRLDTDMVFFSVCFHKLLPVLVVPPWLFVWIGVIALMKLLNLVCGYRKWKHIPAMHTLLNKVAGFSLFLFPLTLPFLDPRYSGSFLCILAFLAALQEGYLLHRKEATRF